MTEFDYQEALKNASKSMVRVKNPRRLLKMITRFVDRELNLTHTSFVVFEAKNKRYVFVDSKGSRRIPMGLVRIDADHALIQWFQHHRSNGHLPKDYLEKNRVKALAFKRSDDQEKIKNIWNTLDMLKIELVIPAYYKRGLLGLMLFGKRKDHRSFSASEISFFQTLAHDCSMAIKTAEYHQNLIDQNAELARHVAEVEKLRKKEHDTYYQIMRSLAQEIKAKDPYTFGHVGQVERLGLMTARELKMDLTGRGKDILTAGLILHDVGKIGIPDHILRKPSRLNEEEWKIMQTHPEKGARILDHLTAFKEVAEIVKSHHEYYDGRGYPRGLKGDQIPIESRIVSVVDAFHAIVSTRCYSKGRPIEEAFKELRRCGGTQFDPAVVEAFIRGLKKEMKKRGVDFFLSDPTIQKKNLK